MYTSGFVVVQDAVYTHTHTNKQQSAAASQGALCRGCVEFCSPHWDKFPPSTVSTWSACNKITEADFVSSFVNYRVFIHVCVSASAVQPADFV